MYYWKPSQPVILGGGNINNLGGRLNERGTFIRINPESVMRKTSMLFVMIKSWQIKDLFARDLTLRKQK